jgi:hypothetical protein
VKNARDTRRAVFRREKQGRAQKKPPKTGRRVATMWGENVIYEWPLCPIYTQGGIAYPMIEPEE